MSTAAEPIAAVSLDVDGTLYSIRRMVLTHPATFLPARPLFRALHAARDELRGLGPLPDLRRQQAERVAQRLGVSCRQASARIEQLIDQRWMAVFDSVRPYAGLRETLAGLVARGLRLALLSDYPIWPKLGGLGLTQLPFAAIVNTEQVGALKPHPAGFERVAERLGLAPGRILHIGDIEGNDVAGALAAGMRAARFYQGRRPATRAAFAFCDWRRLVPLLRWRSWLPLPRRAGCGMRVEEPSQEGSTR